MPRAAAVFHRLLDWIDAVDIASQCGDPRPPFATPAGDPIFPEGENGECWWLTDQQLRNEPPKKANVDDVLEEGQDDGDVQPADDDVQTDDEEQQSDEDAPEEEEDIDGFGGTQSQANAPPQDHAPEVLWTRPPTLERRPPFHYETQRDERVRECMREGRRV